MSSEKGLPRAPAGSPPTSVLLIHPRRPAPAPWAPFGGEACCARGPRAARRCWAAACSPAPPAGPGSSAPGARTPPSSCSRAEAGRLSCRRQRQSTTRRGEPACGASSAPGTGRRGGAGRRGSGATGGRVGAGAASASRRDCYSSRAGKRMVRGSAFSSLCVLPPRRHRWSSNGSLVPARLAGGQPRARGTAPEAAREPPPPAPPSGGSDSKEAREAAPSKTPNLPVLTLGRLGLLHTHSSALPPAPPKVSLTSSTSSQALLSRALVNPFPTRRRLAAGVSARGWGKPEGVCRAQGSGPGAITSCPCPGQRTSPAPGFYSCPRCLPQCQLSDRARPAWTPV